MMTRLAIALITATVALSCTAPTMSPAITSTPPSSAPFTGSPSSTATPFASASPKAATATSTVAPTPAALPTSGIPAFDHVYLIVMENHGYGAIVGSTDAPYINSLIASYGLAT